MQQIVFISGGDAFSDHQDFLEHLRTVELRDPLGGDKESWSKRLRGDLGEQFELYQLAMPNKQNANYTEWQIWFERHLSFLHDGVVLIGWSLGGMFLAKYLSENQLPFRAKRLYLLAAPCGECASAAEPGNDCGTFKFAKENLRKLSASGLPVEIWHSEDDFVVPYSHACHI